MSGKPYTMKEMKGIVDYLTEHKAYGDVKGRKMWVDFANSQLTERSWQSLKETFLKRILTDIHNPYYKLTVDQIRSFREGLDVEAREKNKLEIVNVGEDSDPKSNAETQIEKAQPSTSHENNGEAATGEDIKCSKVQSRDRASVDTIILTNFYETAEEVQKELETSINGGDADATHQSPTKSLRDLITYSEPLTPMLQEVLNDFDSDSDVLRIVEPDVQTEPQNARQQSPIEIFDTEDMINKDTIAETDVKSNDNANKKSNDETVENRNKTSPENIAVETISNNNSVDTNTDANSTADENIEQECATENAEDCIPPKIMSLKLKKRKGKYKIETKEKKKSRSNKSPSVEPEKDVADSNPPKSDKVTEPVVTEISNSANKIDSEENTSNLAKSTSLSNSADTFIPNNQEGFNCPNNNTTTEKHVLSEVKPSETVNATSKNKPRKRAISQDVKGNSKVKKGLLENENKMREKAVSDTDTIMNKLKDKKTKVNFMNKVDEDKDENPKRSEISKKINIAETNDSNKNAPSGDNSEFVSSTQSSQVNPCLKSVSLFAEQFNTISYIESENEATTNGNKKDDAKTTTENVLNVSNEVVILRSHSESDSEPEVVSEKIKKGPNSQVSKSQREKVLANVFGFAHGGPSTKRKKCVSYRKTSTSTYRYPRPESSPESSEWTSESDSEAYVSPPRGRRHRLARKYLKPQSARIMSLEEEGGLFVMYGKKIYPLVKDGKNMKNYLTYLPDSESDREEAESYWKLKYVEEKQKAEQLKRIADENQRINMLREKSPILCNKSKYGSPFKNINQKSGKELPAPVNKPEDEENNKGKTLKITFAKNNQEVHVEGHWSNIHPVLAEVVELFNKDAVPAQQPAPKERTISVHASDASSDKSVAVVPLSIDKDAHEKVNKLETEIFQEIEKLHQEEEVEVKAPTEVNVTTRKRAAKARRSTSQSSTAQNSSPSSTTKPKRQRTGKATEKAAIENGKPDLDQKSIVKETTKSTPISTDDVILEKEHALAEQLPSEDNIPEKKRGRLQKPKESQNKTVASSITTRKATKNDKGTNIETRSSTGTIASRRSLKTPKSPRNNVPEINVLSPQKSDSRLSRKKIESPKKTESDVTKSKIESPKSIRVSKRKIPSPNKVDDETASTSTTNTKPSRRSKKADPEPQASHSKATEPDDDVFLYKFPPAKKPTRSSTIDLNKAREKSTTAVPNIYSSLNILMHSESTQGYQDSDISPPKAIPRRKRKLSLTTARCKTKQHSYRNKRRSYPLANNELSNDSSNGYHFIKAVNQNSSLKSEEYRSDSYQFLFPHKKVFKPLEKIDESRPTNEGSFAIQIKTSDIINRCEEFVTDINKDLIWSSNANTDGANSSSASLPLSPELSIVENLSISQEFIKSAENHPTLNEMQACDLAQTEIHNKYSLSQVDITMPLMQQECGLQESLYKFIEPSFDEAKRSAISESLVHNINKVNIKEETSLSESLDYRLKNLLLESAKKMSAVPPEQDIDIKVQKKGKSKRCSTPRKKKDVQKVKPKIDEPVVEEEFMESCSYSGRKSCPPVIQVISPENIALKENVDMNIEIESKKKSKVKKKKDVIKVKILRPRSKTRIVDKSPKRVHNCSVHDSGINETESVISNEISIDSVDLIHNHSDTCLHANDCLPDSVEFIETSAKSIISLNTDDTESLNSEFPQSQPFRDCEELPEMFCQNAQDFSHVNKVPSSANNNTDNTSDTVFHSPILSDTSANSLITEDLSDELPSSQIEAAKWYLLSEDDTNTNSVAARQNGPLSSFGSNLKQIFHLACAVPNLSTVTEGSESSRKPTSDNDDSTRQDLDSQGILV